MNSTLNNINFGMNEYCGPAVLSALTGKTTDECAAVISAVSGQQVISYVHYSWMLDALKRLRFDAEPVKIVGNSLYSNLVSALVLPGKYIVGVPKHVVAIEVALNEKNERQIFFIDNHTKHVISAGQSARLMQKVHHIYRLKYRGEKELLSSGIAVNFQHLMVTIKHVDSYKDPRDNTVRNLGSFSFKNEAQLHHIIESINREYLKHVHEQDNHDK